MIREIDYIMEVANHGSITKAAEHLYITPSALSKYIQTVEARYNVKLFDRIGKKFVLTYAGERYLHWIRMQQNIMNEMETELADISNSLCGTIKVGFQMGFSDFWISNVLPEFTALYPGVKIELIEDVSSEIALAVSNNEVDFALSEIHSTAKEINYHNLYDETLVVAASAGEAGLEAAAVKKSGHKYPWLPPEAVNKCRFILPFPSQRTYKIIEDILEGTGIEINNMISARQITAILKSIAAGSGISIVPDFAVLSGDCADQIKVYSFGNEPVNRPFAVMYHRQHFLTEAAEALIEMTIEKYNNMKV